MCCHVERESGQLVHVLFSTPLCVELYVVYTSVGSDRFQPAASRV